MKSKPMVLTVEEAGALLRLGRQNVYRLITRGSIKGFKLGGDWRITTESVEKIVGSIPPSFFLKKKKTIPELNKIENR